MSCLRPTSSGAFGSPCYEESVVSTGANDTLGVELEAALRARGLRPTELLSRTSSTEVWRVLDRAGVSAIAKCMIDATDEARRRMHHEFVIARGLPEEVAPRHRELLSVMGIPVMIQDDVGVASLDRVIDRARLELDEALDVAIALADALALLHGHGIVHRDINPSNVAYSPNDARAYLLDFGLATGTPVADARFTSPHRVEGTLAYVAPEQAGRTSQHIDHRADLYSLGVTLFELCTGSLPFSDDDPLALLHEHVAAPPPSLRDRLADAPAGLDELVSALLAKEPWARVGSASKVAASLRSIRAGTWRGLELGRGVESVRGGGRLFGREEALELLRARCLDGVERGSVCLIAGYSGVGKSALARELKPDITAARGVLFESKYDLARDEQTLLFVEDTFGRQLADYILAEPDEELEWLRARIREDDGVELASVALFLPRLAIALGATIEDAPRALRRVPPPGALAALGQALVGICQIWCERVFTVLFIDDMQWSDPLDLVIIEALSEARVPGLTLLGAYRDNEVGPGHPILPHVRRVADRGGVVELAPLGIGALEEWVHELFALDDEQSITLAAALFARTGGNPFFTTRYIEKLVRDEVLVEAAGRWMLALDPTNHMPPSANVIEVLSDEVGGLGDGALELLAAAAIFGATFFVGLLAASTEVDMSRVVSHLERAANLGFVEPLTSLRTLEVDGVTSAARAWEIEFAFVHDRIQSACLESIDATRRDDLLACIADVVIERADERADESLFLRGVTLLGAVRQRADEGDDLDRVIELNRRAAEIALGRARFSLASGYCAVALELLGDLGVSEARVDLLLLAARATFLAGEMSRSDALHQQLDALDLDASARREQQQIRIDQCLFQGRFDEAIEVGLASLALAEVELPREPDAATARLHELHELIEDAMRPRGVDCFASLGRSPDILYHFTVHALYGVFLAAYLSGQRELGFAALGTSVWMCLSRGHAPLSGYTLVGYAMVLTMEEGRRQLGHEIARFGVELSESHDPPELCAKTNFIFAADVHSWTKPISDALDYYKRAEVLARQTGDWLTVGYIAIQLGSDLLTAGWQLAELAERVGDYEHFLTRKHNDAANMLLRAGVIQPIMHLRGETRSWDSFDCDAFCEADFIEEYEDNGFYLAWLYSGRIRAAVYIGAEEDYAMWASRVEVIKHNVPSHTKVPECVFYAGILELRVYDMASDEGARARALAHLEALREWCKDQPANLTGKLALLEAEYASRCDRGEDAARLYEEAIDWAVEVGSPGLRGLALELYGLFWERRGVRRAAAMFIRESIDAYREWGALGKVADLEARHMTAKSKRVVDDRRLTRRLSHADLDLEAAARAAAAVAEASGFESVLRTLTQVAAESSASRRVVVFFEDALVADLEVDEFFFAQDARARDLAGSELQRFARVARRTGDVYVGGDEFDRPYLAIPLWLRGHVHGAIVLEGAVASNSFDDRGVSLLRFLSGFIGNTLMTATLNEALQATNDELATREELLQRSLADKEVLLREVHHRVKNNLQVISSLLSMGGRTIPEGASRDALRDSATRVRAIALIHEHLYRDTSFERIDFGAYIRQLSGSLRQTLAPEVLLTCEVEPAELSIDTALSLGLILNELLTNAFKHGAPSAGNPTVRVALSVTDEIELVVEDNGEGVSMSVFEARETLGLQLVSSLCRQLRARLDVARGERGARFEIRCPVSQGEVEPTGA